MDEIIGTLVWRHCVWTTQTVGWVVQYPEPEEEGNSVLYRHDLWTWSSSVTIKYSESKRCTPPLRDVYNVFVCGVIQNVVCSVNTITPHINHQVCSVTCSVNHRKKVSIEVFTPKFRQLRHSFHELGIMPNIQSKSLETTVLVLFDLMVHPPIGHAVHRQFTTLTLSKDTLSTLSTAPNGRGWSPETPKSQRNRTKHPLAHDLIVCSSIDMIWGDILVLEDPEIPDPTSQVTPDPDVSPGVRCS